MFAGGDPAAGLNAEHAQIDRIAFGGHDAIFANHAILLATRDDLAGEQQKRALRIVDQHEPVDLRAVVANPRIRMPANQPLHAPRFRNDDLSRAQALVKSQEFAGGITLRSDYGKDREIPMTNGIEHLVIPRRRWRRPLLRHRAIAA